MEHSSPRKSSLFQSPSLLLSLLIPLAVGGLSAFLTRNSMDIYSSLQLPLFAPPSWLFPVAWSVLYLLMGWSCWRILQHDRRERGSALLLYGAQLVLNFLWPLFFFIGRQWFVSLLILLALLLVVLVMVRAFYRIDHKAAFLQIPYCLWLGFALYLNWMIWLLN